MTRMVRHRRRAALTAIVAAALVGAAGLALGAPGDLDPGFDGEGRVVIDYGGADRANDVLVQPDGKILAAGERRGASWGRPR
jgi:hypothetical protein